MGRSEKFYVHAPTLKEENIGNVTVCSMMLGSDQFESFSKDTLVGFCFRWWELDYHEIIIMSYSQYYHLPACKSPVDNMHISGSILMQNCHKLAHLSLSLAWFCLSFSPFERWTQEDQPIWKKSNSVILSFHLHLNREMQPVPRETNSSLGPSGSKSIQF